MKTWAIHSYDFLTAINSNSVLYPDTKIIKKYNGSFLEEKKILYDFICNRLENYCARPNPSIEYPFWHWIWYAGYRNPLPDLRELRWHYGIPGKKYIRIEFDIPEKKLLRFDWNKWLMLLLPDYLYFLPKKRQKEIKLLLKAKNIKKWEFPYPDQYFHAINEEIIDSWKNLFVYNYRTFQVIGITWELRKEWVRKIDFFTIDKRAFCYSKLVEETSTK
ncbi:MAG: DUF3841 domain-containing protein [Candidatus Lokiarchaeota archaeon]|nr:DUF3841 domain-containing protein [Candidatus Harpocratesius repetitus]